jgi:hypothetical protein
VICNERTPQDLGTRGSLKWIQLLVENHSTLVTDAIRAASGRPPEWTIDWVSPRAHDEWAEYRDAGLVKALRMPSLAASLRAFWPDCGPRWDALGKASGGGAVLVEAKAHFGELDSTCGAGDTSLPLITKSLAGTKEWLGVSDAADWHNGYYQYANRLAHLRFLQQLGVDASLVFVYFCGDVEMRGPTSAAEWQDQLKAVYDHLGLTGDLSARRIVNVYVPVAAL